MPGSGGFKITDAYVEISARNEVPTVIGKVDSDLKAIKDKKVAVTADDQASSTIKKIDSEKPSDKIINFVTDSTGALTAIETIDRKDVKDKDVKVKADDQASEVIDKVSKKKPDPIPIHLELIDETKKDLEKAGGDLQGWAKKTGIGMGLTLGGLLAAGLAQSNVVAEFENQMGATSAVAEHYGQVAGHVFGAGFADSKDTVSAALNALSSDMQGFGNLASDEQEKIAGQAVKVASNFGDVNTVMKAATNLVSNGMAPSFSAAFDLITAGQQQMGSKGEDLLDTLNEYPGYFKALGFSGNEALGLIQRMLQAGAQDTDKAADAIKEFGIRIVEAGGTAEPALADLGFNVQQMQQQFAAGGESAKNAFITVVRALQDVKDPADRARISVGLFGTQSEDTMLRLLPKLDLTSLGLSNVAGSADRLKSTLTPMQQLTNAFSDAMTQIAPVAIPVVAAIGAVIGVVGKLAGALNDLTSETKRNPGMGITQIQEQVKTATMDMTHQSSRLTDVMKSIVDSTSGGGDALKKFGITYEDMATIVQGGAGANEALEKFNVGLSTARKNGDPLADAMGTLNSSMGVAQMQFTATGHSIEYTSQAFALAGSVNTGYYASLDVMDAALRKAETGQDGLGGASQTAADKMNQAAAAARDNESAIKKLNDAVMGAIDKSLSYQQSVLSTKDAQKALNDTLKKNKAGSDEAQSATINLEQAQVRQAQAAQAQATANSKAGDEAGKAADGHSAFAKEVINMAVAANGAGTPALESMVSSLTDTQLKALGAHREVDGAGNAIISLPNGKTMTVDAKDNATPVISNIANKEYTAVVKLTGVWAGYSQLPNGVVLSGSSARGNADGGPISGPGGPRADVIPIMASNGEYMINAVATAKNRRWLDWINYGGGDMSALGMAGGGLVGQQASVAAGTINNYWTAPPDIDIEQLAARVSRKMELQRQGRS